MGRASRSLMSSRSDSILSIDRVSWFTVITSDAALIGLLSKYPSRVDDTDTLLMIVWIMRHEHEEEDFTFVPLAAATANVVKWLSEVKHDAGKHHGNKETGGQNDNSESAGSALASVVVARDDV